jgi:uncharacterized protein YkwD
MGAVLRRLSATSTVRRAGLLLLAAAAFGAPAGRAAAPPKPATASKAPRIERAVVRCTNRERARYGLARLHPNSVLRRAAEYHARNMLRYSFFSHNDPFGHGPVARVNLFGNAHHYRWLGENLATGFGSAGAACAAWMASAHHRANVLNPHFRLIGVGVARSAGASYFVEDFGSYRR